MLPGARIAVLLIVLSAVTGVAMASDHGEEGGGGHSSDSAGTSGAESGSSGGAGGAGSGDDGTSSSSSGSSGSEGNTGSSGAAEGSYGTSSPDSSPYSTPAGSSSEHTGERSSVATDDDNGRSSSVPGTSSPAGSERDDRTSGSQDYAQAPGTDLSGVHSTGEHDDRSGEADGRGTADARARETDGDSKNNRGDQPGTRDLSPSHGVRDGTNGEKPEGQHATGTGGDKNPGWEYSSRQKSPDDDRERSGKGTGLKDSGTAGDANPGGIDREDRQGARSEGTDIVFPGSIALAADAQGREEPAGMDDRGRSGSPRLPSPDSGREKNSREPPGDHVPYGEVPFAHVPVVPGTAAGLPLGTAAPPLTGATGPAARAKAKGEHEPFWSRTDSALILSPFMLLKICLYLGFRRVEKKNVLEHDERKILYENIETNPGVDLARLVESLGLNKETARYHLKMLSSKGKISGIIKQGIARYFPNKETISEFEKTVIHYLWISTTKRILLLLLDTPGLTRQAIAGELGIAGPSVTWQMQRLADDGLIEVRNEGRFVHYFLTRNGIETLQTARNRVGSGFAA